MEAVFFCPHLSELSNFDCMKNLKAIALIICLALQANAQAQLTDSLPDSSSNEEQYEPSNFDRFKRKMAIRWHFAGAGTLRELAPRVAYKNYPSTVVGADTIMVHGAEAGISLVRGDRNNWDAGFMWLGMDWMYNSYDFSLEYRFVNGISRDYEESLSQDVPQLWLHTSATFGAGFLALVFPLGGYATGGLSTDFNDLYLKGGLGFEIFRVSIGSGYYVNLTKTGPLQQGTPGYYIDVAIRWWDK